MNRIIILIFAFMLFYSGSVNCQGLYVSPGIQCSWNSELGGSVSFQLTFGFGYIVIYPGITGGYRYYFREKSSFYFADGQLASPLGGIGYGFGEFYKNPPTIDGKIVTNGRRKKIWVGFGLNYTEDWLYIDEIKLMIKNNGLILVAPSAWFY